MHYHIFWGLRTAEEPFILNFSDRDEAIDKFISLIKEIEGDSVKDGPPPWDEVELNDKTRMFRILSDQYKYLLVYCSNNCNAEKPTNPLNIN